MSEGRCAFRWNAAVVPRRTAVESRIPSSTLCEGLELSSGSSAARVVMAVALPPTSANALEAPPMWTDQLLSVEQDVCTQASTSLAPNRLCDHDFDLLLCSAGGLFRQGVEHPRWHMLVERIPGFEINC